MLTPYLRFFGSGIVCIIKLRYSRKPITLSPITLLQFLQEEQSRLVQSIVMTISKSMKTGTEYLGLFLASH